MALAIYWQEGPQKRHLGSLEIDTPLEDLLYKFGELTGIPLDFYGKARLHPAQWPRLLVLAEQQAYPPQHLKEIAAGLPENQSKGILVLLGD